jgi:hypothetical protein
MGPEIPSFILDFLRMSHQRIIKINIPCFSSVHITVDDLHVIDQVVFEVFGLEEVGEEVIDGGRAFVVLDDVEPH